MNIKLNKPIAFIDLETTGLNIANDRIVEYSILKISPDGTKTTKTQRLNPSIPIPDESSSIHGIYDQDVENEPTFKDISKELAAFLKDCDLAGYNSDRFDVPLLVEEFLRADIDFDMKNRKTVDVQTIFHKMEQRTLKAAYQFYCNKDLENAHSAEADILATFEVLEAQIDRYKELKPDVGSLHMFAKQNNNVDFAGRIIYNKDGYEVFNFGKHKGKLVTKVLESEPSYYAWMMEGDFPLYTKKILTSIRLNMLSNK